MSIEKEQLLKRTSVFDGKLLKIYSDDVKIAGQISWREVVIHPGAAAIIPMTDNREILFVRQYRYAVGKTLLEIPAGKLDKGEDPDVCASRELIEETGFSSAHIQKLGSICTTPGFCNETIHIYLADCLQAASQHLDADEFLDVIKIPLAEVWEKIANGDIEDAKTLAAFALAADRLKAM